MYPSGGLISPAGNNDASKNVASGFSTNRCMLVSRLVFG
jgi:hypothetical protein